MNTWTILQGSCIDTLPTLLAESAQCCVTSPPYWGLRDYGHPGQLGLEKTPQEYVENMVRVFREVRRVLRNDGTLWVNLGDSYCNHRTHNGGGAPTNTVHRGGKRDGTENHYRPNRSERYGIREKNLNGIPWRVAFALQDDGWELRRDIVWQKPNPMPEKVDDRPTTAHEYLFLFSQSLRYHYDAAAIREPANDGETRNARSVWTIPTEPIEEAHIAVMPRALARRCILAGCPVGGTVLDPFGGAGTVAVEATALGRNAVICELNPAYVEIARRRVAAEVPLLAREVVA
jgi:DNA modification methylase